MRYKRHLKMRTLGSRSTAQMEYDEMERLIFSKLGKEYYQQMKELEKIFKNEIL